VTTKKQYDYLNRLSAVGFLPAADQAFGSRYLHNDAGQRVRNFQPNGSYLVYQYDSLSRVPSQPTTCASTE
jgi:hypothetical protein